MQNKNWIGNALFTVAVMDLKVRYENSRLGFVWSIIKPLFQFVVYYFIFGSILKVEHQPHYALRLFLGVIIWAFFAESTSNGATSLISKKGLITKVMVPTSLGPLASYVTSLLNFLINFCVFLVFYMLSVKGWSLRIGGINALLLLYSFVIITMLVIALNLILSLANPFFRDVQQIWDLVLNYGVFLTPIIYTLPIPKNMMGLYYGINALAVPIDLFRQGLFGNSSATQSIEPLEIVINFFVCIVLLLVGVVMHMRFGRKVMDYL